MNIQDIRRANLRKWVSVYGTPSKEKSYFSQVLNGDAPIGERAARRLEEDYKMGAMALDASPEQQAIVAANDTEITANEIFALLEDIKIASPSDRAMILKAAQLAGDRARSILGASSVGNQG